MRAVVQRVAQASVSGGGKTAAIGKGFLLPQLRSCGSILLNPRYPFSIYIPQNQYFVRSIRLNRRHGGVMGDVSPRVTGLCVLLGITTDDTVRLCSKTDPILRSTYPTPVTASILN